jgi:hypothetical protein
MRKWRLLGKTPAHLMLDFHHNMKQFRWKYMPKEKLILQLAKVQDRRLLWGMGSNSWLFHAQVDL